MENRGDSDEIPHNAAIHNELSHISCSGVTGKDFQLKLNLFVLILL